MTLYYKVLIDTYSYLKRNLFFVIIIKNSLLCLSFVINQVKTNKHNRCHFKDNLIYCILKRSFNASFA